MNCVRSEKNSGPNKTRPLNLTRRAAQCSISETYIRKRGHEGACGKLFKTGIYLRAKGIGDSAPSRSRLGPGVKEVESLGGRRKTASQPLRSRWHTEADGRTQAEAPTFRSQVLAFSNYSKDHKSMSLECLNFVKKILSALGENPGLVLGRTTFSLELFTTPGATQLEKQLLE